MSGADVERLVADERIIRHRGKIEATINNARRAADLAEEYGSLGAFFWGYEPDRRRTVDIPPVTDESIAMAKALKARGFRYVGPTTCYAFMEAMGIVNDHVPGCVAGDEVDAARAVFTRPLPSPG